MLAVAGAKLARRTLLLTLVAFLGAANGLSALAPTYHWMLFSRFLSGVPHGAYFGVAALVAASLGTRKQRGQALARMFLGVTTATIIGAPASNALGQLVGWRWGFAFVACLAGVTALLISLFAPCDRPEAGASAWRELGALRNAQVWLTLGTGAVGFGGLFAVYAYLASTLASVTHAPAAVVPFVFSVFGLGLTLGNLAWGWVADRALMPAAAGALVWAAVASALYPLACGHLLGLMLVVFMVGGGGGLAVVLQSRLMNVAAEAQTLAAALNHSAFNLANALGPWLGGLVIAAGCGLPSTGWVGVGLALGGLGMWSASVLLERGKLHEPGSWVN